MRIGASVLALLLVLGVLFETFEVMLMPRRTPHRVRFVRVFLRLTWRIWSALAEIKRPDLGRQAFLAVYGPLSIVLLIVTWIAGLILGFGLLQWSVEGGLVPRPSLSSQLYMSGETFFTLGYGDIVPQTPLGRFIGVVESGTGFGFIAVVIGYLPVLYQFYARREIHIMQLDARAGSPPSGLTLVCRHTAAGATDELVALLRSWETWCSELLVSHLSYPMLSYYRSQQDSQSWLAGLGAVMDCCALILVEFDGMRAFEARVTFAMGRLTLLEMSRVFEAVPQGGIDRLPHTDYLKLAACLSEAGLLWRDADAAEERLAAIRETYEPFLDVLSRYLLLPLPEWLPPPRDRANWHRGAEVAAQKWMGWK